MMHLIDCYRSVGLLLAGLCVAGLMAATAGAADDPKFNYDEDKVPNFVLPDPLVMNDGRPVNSAAMWRHQRRPELLTMFEQNVYGRRPPEPKGMRFHVTETDWHDKGVRKKVDVTFFSDGKSYPGFTITVFAPRRGRRPVPAFVGMHLFDTKDEDPFPGKLLTEDVGMPLPGKDILSVILDRGYAVASLDAADFCPDDKEKFREGLQKQWYPDRSGPPGPDEPGAIATWAWGLSRALDYFACDPSIDASRVAVIGHSRMGKTALWAGAEDPRFAMVISNDSGCGGAALSRRRFGETVARINNVFPHWFCENFSKYNDREDQLPLDQHELVALSAPRPVYVASAQEDGWADPRGELLSARAAEPVYQLFNKQGIGTDEVPLNQSVGQSIGYHKRAGKHALTDFDWLKYLDFADRHLR